MNYIDEFAYGCYLSEQYKGRAELDAFVNECILIAEGTNDLSNVVALHESIGDSIKAAFAKIIEVASRIWGKFLETLNTLVQRDKGYLEKYKDVILTKKNPNNYKYTMYNYMQGQKTLLNTSVPNFNYGAMKENLNDAELFNKRYFNHVVGGNTGYKLEDLARNAFRGGSKEIQIDSNQINMTDIWNYCYNYSKVKDAISKDSKNIATAGKEAMDQVDKLVRDGAVQSESVFEKGKYYSFVYEQYITEEENPKPENKPGGGGGKVQVDSVNGKDPKQNENGTNSNTTNPADAYKTNTGETKTDINPNGESAKDIQSRISVYLKSCSAIMAARMHVAEEAYKAYMFVIKAHVRDIVGTKAEGKQKDQASTQGKSNNPDDAKKQAKDKDVVNSSKEAINNLLSN